jgi:dipeptidyl aminopeptidase/acylaminoacyl peptidase
VLLAIYGSSAYHLPMNQKQIAPYGGWKSSITSELIVTGALRLGGTQIDGTDIYWLEGRAQEGGRNVLVQQMANGQIRDAVPPESNVRTRVHEYGGGAYWVAAGVVYFVHFDDQRLYRLDPGRTPVPLTPAGMDVRFADGLVDAARNRLICVREDHRGDGEAVNTLVSIPLDGEPHAGDILAGGNDFYASPRLSRDEQQLAWLTWNHPNMPWDGTELWVADINADGQLQNAQLVAGGIAESIFQPEWSPQNDLHFISDRNGWWNLYRRHEGQIEALHERAAEFGRPQWVFGMSTYGFRPDGTIICKYTEKGIDYLAQLDSTSGHLTAYDLPYAVLGNIQVGADYVLFTGGAPTEMTALVRYHLDQQSLTVLRRRSQLTLDTGYFSVPEAIEFPTANDQTAHAFYYPPHNQDFSAPAGELPPLILISHGGPTGATDPALNLGIQFWTSRGFGVVDVNYGGSVGYGRAYRQRLNGRWGVVDVQDCLHAARFLAASGRVDPDRLIIRGGSAGGYTTLAVLTFHDEFAAGASYYGIGDLTALAEETHKFESRYLDSMIGPYPEQADLYHKRSPIHFSEQLNCPVIFFQGLEDKVVLPNQAEMMVAAMQARGVPVAYVPFAGEQHGFRRAETIMRALDAELYFYSRVFNFPLAEPVEPVPIANL